MIAKSPNSIALNPKEINKNASEKHDYSPLLCPFRKRTFYMASNNDGEFSTYVGKAEFTEEDFLPCVKEKCMKFNRVTGCGM